MVKPLGSVQWAQPKLVLAIITISLLSSLLCRIVKQNVGLAKVFGANSIKKQQFIVGELVFLVFAAIYSCVLLYYTKKSCRKKESFTFLENASQESTKTILDRTYIVVMIASIVNFAVALFNAVRSKSNAIAWGFSGSCLVLCVINLGISWQYQQQHRARDFAALHKLWWIVWTSFRGLVGRLPAYLFISFAFDHVLAGKSGKQVSLTNVAMGFALWWPALAAILLLSLVIGHCISVGPTSVQVSDEELRSRWRLGLIRKLTILPLVVALLFNAVNRSKSTIPTGNASEYTVVSILQCYSSLPKTTLNNALNQGHCQRLTTEFIQAQAIKSVLEKVTLLMDANEDDALSQLQELLMWIDSTPSSVYKESCSLLFNIAIPCIKEMAIPEFQRAIDSEENAYCDQMRTNVEAVMGESWSAVLLHLTDYIGDLICSEKKASNGDRLTCGEAIVKTMKFSSVSDVVNQMLRLVQIPNHEGCKAFQGQTYLSTKEEPSYFNIIDPLDSCSSVFDALMIYVRSVPWLQPKGAGSDFLQVPLDHLFAEKACILADDIRKKLEVYYVTNSITGWYTEAQVLTMILPTGVCFHFVNTFAEECQFKTELVYPEFDQSIPITRDPIFFLLSGLCGISLVTTLALEFAVRLEHARKYAGCLKKSEIITEI